MKNKYVFKYSLIGDYNFDVTAPKGYIYYGYEIDESSQIIIHIFKLIE
ncbi:MAG: hypothetical protein KQ78_01794 [Candidatus Izimaplasma bacterium HR2]|nr:MAG: hypothetical protein KQ78_01794 [Candidatus Izimaplasma bacterium HR2]